MRDSRGAQGRVVACKTWVKGIRGLSLHTCIFDSGAAAKVLALAGLGTARASRTHVPKLSHTGIITYEGSIPYTCRVYLRSSVGCLPTEEHAWEYSGTCMCGCVLCVCASIMCNPSLTHEHTAAEELVFTVHVSASNQHVPHAVPVGAWCVCIWAYLRCGQSRSRVL